MDNIIVKIASRRKLVVSIVLAMYVLAAVAGIAFGDALDTVHSSLANLGSNVRSFGGILCVVSAIYVGLMFVLSAINPKLKDNAKNGMWGLLFGVLILLFSDQITYIIAELTGNSGNALNRR